MDKALSSTSANLLQNQYESTQAQDHSSRTGVLPSQSFTYDAEPYNCIYTDKLFNLPGSSHYTSGLDTMNGSYLYSMDSLNNYFEQPQHVYVSLDGSGLLPAESVASYEISKQSSASQSAWASTSADENIREMRREARRRVRDKRKLKMTTYWRFLLATNAKKETSFLINRYLDLMGHRICRNTAKNHLEINCDSDTAEDLKSDEPERLQKAMHKLNFCITDDLFNNEEKARMHEIILDRFQIGEESAWSVYYQGRKRLPQEEKRKYRAMLHKSDELLVTIADKLHDEYLKYHSEMGKDRNGRTKAERRLFRLGEATSIN